MRHGAVGNGKHHPGQRAGPAPCRRTPPRGQSDGPDPAPGYWLRGRGLTLRGSLGGRHHRQDDRVCGRAVPDAGHRRVDRDHLVEVGERAGGAPVEVVGAPPGVFVDGIEVHMSDRVVLYGDGTVAIVRVWQFYGLFRGQPVE